jgi:hypothetical protein
MLAYARQHRLRLLGKGSSRTTYLLTPKTVLKIAHGDKLTYPSLEAGIAQNKKEVAVSKDPKTKFITARVLQSHPEGLWLVSELVRELENWTEWDEYIEPTPEAKEIGWATHESFFNLVEKIFYTPKADEERIKKMYDRGGIAYNELNQKVVSGIVHLLHRHDLDIGELMVADHWGKTPDGRFVILDYGFDSDVADAFYENQSLQEKVRSKSFKWNEFKALDDPLAMQAYLDSHLERLGGGSSRTVYLLTPKTVIKVGHFTDATRGHKAAPHKTKPKLKCRKTLASTFF